MYFARGPREVQGVALAGKPWSLAAKKKWQRRKKILGTGDPDLKSSSHNGKKRIKTNSSPKALEKDLLPCDAGNRSLASEGKIKKKWEGEA